MKPIPPSATLPVTEAELHAYVDAQLPQERYREIEAYLSARPGEAERVASYKAQKNELRALFNSVLDEPIPTRLQHAAAPRRPWYLERLAAGIAIAAVSAGSAWFLRGTVEADSQRLAATERVIQQASLNNGSLEASNSLTGNTLTGFARRAAVAHVVYSPDIRRPVEVGADQEQQLVAWLSKRLGTEVKPPSLQPIGYELIGGRLLPGDSGPVAQFMYHDKIGQRLTLYVTREAPKITGQSETAFRFGQDGPVNVFYWVDKNFGYAISGGADRPELMRVAKEIYRQLAPT